MATKSENSEIAVLQTQMEDVKDTLAELKADTQKGFDEVKLQLSVLSNTYLTRGEFEVYKHNLTDAQAPGKELLENVKEKVITAIVWGVIVGLILVLITYFNYVILHIAPNGGTSTSSSTTSSTTTPSTTPTSATTETPSTATSPSSGGGVTVPLPIK